jgi:NadR type nicotinamide-nucleotide adenylyltransferase
MIPEKIKRIAFIGPESSGKTTLCKQLADYYKTFWVAEYSREYMEQLNRPYTLEDILLISKKQLENEQELLMKSNNLLFADTELINSKVWCEDKFEYCPEWISEKIEEKKYDLYLLTKPDLPWQPDPVRENPTRRDYFYNLYLKELQTRKFNYEIIAGEGDTRFNNAVKAVDEFLKNS